MITCDATKSFVDALEHYYDERLLAGADDENSRALWQDLMKSSENTGEKPSEAAVRIEKIERFSMEEVMPTQIIAVNVSCPYGCTGQCEVTTGAGSSRCQACAACVDSANCCNPQSGDCVRVDCP